MGTLKNFLYEHKLLIGILFLAALLRFWGIAWGLPHEYQTEEYKVIKYALRMGSGDFNPHFFEYPSLYLYFLLTVFGFYFAVGKALGWFVSTQAFALAFIKDPTYFYLIGRYLEAAFNLGILVVTYQIGRLFFSKKAGIFAALVLAVLPVAVNKSHYIKGDQAAMLLGLIFWICCYQVYKTADKKYYYICALLLGLAISTKYYMAVMGAGFLTAHFLSSNRFWYRHFIISLFLIPVFFLVGSPYALTSEEFKTFVVDFKSIFLEFKTTKEVSVPYSSRLLKASANMLRMYDGAPLWGIGSWGVGFLSLFGVFFTAWKKGKESLLVIMPIVAYWLCVSVFFHPAAGYMVPIFPLFILCGAFAFSEIMRSTFTAPKIFLVALALLAFGAATVESTLISYQYSLPDTRTLASDWIKKNLPAESFILADVLPSSPPLEMSQAQLQKFYRIAQENHHYKTEFFKLKLQAFDAASVHYNIVVVKRLAQEIGSLPDQVRQVQMTQDLFDLSGDDSDFTRLKEQGVKYVIVNSAAQQSAVGRMPRIEYFYTHLPLHAKLLRAFDPPSRFYPGPSIAIYEI